MDENSKKKGSIPIVVGVSGHRDVIVEDIPVLKEAVNKELKKLIEQYPHSEIVMLNSIASGADTLCAQCALELGIKLRCPLPLPINEYRQDFSSSEADDFEMLLQKAQEVFVAPNVETPPAAGSENPRDFHYRQAGLYVALHSHLLIVLWSGNKGKPGGCGTAEIVDAILNDNYLPAGGRTIHTGKNEAVLQIYTPRKSEIHNLSENGKFQAGDMIWHGNQDGFLDILNKTEKLNALSKKIPCCERSESLVQDESDPVLNHLEKVYDLADQASIRYAESYRKVLASLALCGTILTLAFLLYDEANMLWLIFICGAMLICAALILYYARKSDCHRRYIEYRTLAEGLRVQSYLRYAGSRIEAAELFTWAQKLETGWIMKAIQTVSAGPVPQKAHEITDCWIRQQKDYHHKAKIRTGKAYTKSERIVNGALILSILLYLTALFFEIVILGSTLAGNDGWTDPDFWRSLLKIILGTISAGTLFISDYYGKQSLSRKVSDHTKMAGFYEMMEKKILMFGQTEGILELLSREELIENSNWWAYQSDNKPEIGI